MIRRSQPGPSKIRQNRLARSAGAVRLTASERTSASAASAPKRPTGSASAALLINTANVGASHASAIIAGEHACSMPATSARSTFTNLHPALTSRSLVPRPTPRTRKPWPCSACAIDSPSPRDAPVTMAARIVTAALPADTRAGIWWARHCRGWPERTTAGTAGRCWCLRQAGVRRQGNRLHACRPEA